MKLSYISAKAKEIGPIHQRRACDTGLGVAQGVVNQAVNGPVQQGGMDTV
ncbi:hypothetical protein NK428_003156 [Vibrio navarrensis]|nr:hypothetical protein [Vibrio navarrensis]